MGYHYITDKLTHSGHLKGPVCSLDYEMAATWHWLTSTQSTWLNSLIWPCIIDDNINDGTINSKQTGCIIAPLQQDNTHFPAPLQTENI